MSSTFHQLYLLCRHNQVIIECLKFYGFDVVIVAVQTKIVFPDELEDGEDSNLDYALPGGPGGPGTGRASP